MINLQSNQHAFVAGRTQEGKTTFIRSFINKYPRVVVHDRKHEWAPFAQRNHYYIVNTPDQLSNLLLKGAKRIVYQPTSPRIDDFDEVCHIIYDLGNITFVIDEASSYCAIGKVPYHCSELFRLGSGRGIGVISLTQRPRKVDNELLSESTIIVSFRLMLDTDRAKIAETCGKIVNPALPEDPEDAKHIRSIATMPKYHFMVFDSVTARVSWHPPIPVRTE